MVEVERGFRGCTCKGQAPIFGAQVLIGFMMWLVAGASASPACLAVESQLEYCRQPFVDLYPVASCCYELVEFEATRREDSF